MWRFGSCRSLLTARSSSSELKRLSKSFMDTTKSVSWMRLVEAIRLWAAPRWASAQQYLVLTSRDLRYGSSQFHLKEMNTEWTLHKAIKYFFTPQTYFNVPLILPIFTCNLKLKENIELLMAWMILFTFHSSWLTVVKTYDYNIKALWEVGRLSGEWQMQGGYFTTFLTIWWPQFSIFSLWEKKKEFKINMTANF